MLPVRQNQYKPVYYLQRPQSPKNGLGHVQSAKNLSLTMSIGANQSPMNFLPLQKYKQEQNLQPPIETTSPNHPDKFERMDYEMKMISKQNATLREENQILKKQLNKFRRENAAENVRSTEKYQPVSPEAFSNDLRGTIKKETGQIKELKLKLDMVSKQCKMYEEIIDKMDERIKKLNHQNHKKGIQIDEMQAELTKLDQLKEKTNSLMRLYNELQSKFNNDQLDWMKWKQSWLTQKEYYLNRIKDLENMTQKKYC